MTKIDQDRAAAKINGLAARNSWPLISDSTLNFVTPGLKTAFEIWQTKCAGRLMPRRSDFFLRDLKEVSPNLAFIEIQQTGPRIRLKAKLVGTELDRFIGSSVTGRFLDEAVPMRFAEKWLGLWKPAIEERTPTRTVGRVEYADKKYYMSEALHAPLSEDGEVIDTLMLVAYFHFTHSGDPVGDDIAKSLMSEIGECATSMQ